MTRVRPSRAIEHRDQPRVDGIRLAWIHHPLTPGRRFHPHDPDQKAVLRAGEKPMQGIPRDRDAPRPERPAELLHAERRAGVPREMPHEPAQARHVADAVALDHVGQHRRVDVVPQKPPPGRRIEPLDLRKAAGFEPVQQCALQPRTRPARHAGRRFRLLLQPRPRPGPSRRMLPRWRSASSKLHGWIGTCHARPRSAVATSRDSRAADEPVTNTSACSVSMSRPTNRSHPGTTWISSKHHVTAAVVPCGAVAPGEMGSRRWYSLTTALRWDASRPAKGSRRYGPSTPWDG